MKRRLPWLALLGWATSFVLLPSLEAQRRPYIGYTYPAGAQQGTTCQIKLGGQDLDDVNAVLVTGTGVSARVVNYYRRLNNQEMQLLREQLKLLKQGRGPGKSVASSTKEVSPDSVSAMVEKIQADAANGESSSGVSVEQLIAAIEQRTREWVQTPACSSISSLVIAEVTIAPDASPGTRELRLVTPRGVSNPLVFQIGQLTEYARPPMRTATLHVLGKEALALRNRPASEAERSVTLPCTVNGQIAAREVNRYRFEATKGQRLVISTQARQLIPYVADAVPGWFQPVVALYDDQGNEVAFADDYRFKPDPVILYQVPRDGQYVLEIHDSLYRGREDFIYRISMGELPFVTSLFPAGRTAGSAVTPRTTGWNLGKAQPSAVESPKPGMQILAITQNGLSSNFVPFAIDRLPDEFDREGNDSLANAQKVALPVIVNGRVDRADDWDVFQFSGKAGETVVAEVHARRLDSPLDSVIKLTDAAGQVFAFSDDHEDLTSGINTHHADSYFAVKLPADGDYFVHLGDTARNGGEEYVYRLRISAPQPDFELRVVPSSISVGVNATAAVSVYAARKDGFSGPIRITLKDPPPGLTATPVTLSPTQSVARLALRAGLTRSEKPLRIAIAGSAKIGTDEIVHEAVPAEDRMQAFLWRHLVPASDLRVMIFDPRYQPPPKRAVPARPEPVAVAALNPVPAAAPVVATDSNSTVAATAPPAPAKPKFTKQQIAGRLRQLKLLYEEGLLTDGFYSAKVAECEDGP